MLGFFPPCDNEQSGWPQVLCAGPLNSSSVSMRSAATWWRHSVAWWAGGGAPVLSRKRNLRWYVVAGPYQMNQSSSWTLKTLWVFSWLVFSRLRRVPWVTSCIFFPLSLTVFCLNDQWFAGSGLDWAAGPQPAPNLHNWWVCWCTCSHIKFYYILSEWTSVLTWVGGHVPVKKEKYTFIYLEMLWCRMCWTVIVVNQIRDENLFLMISPQWASCCFSLV